MEDALFRRAKLEAARQGRSLSDVFEQALKAYFANPDVPQRTHLTVAESSGAMAVPPDVLREILEDEDEYGVS